MELLACSQGKLEVKLECFKFGKLDRFFQPHFIWRSMRSCSMYCISPYTQSILHAPRSEAMLYTV